MFEKEAEEYLMNHFCKKVDEELIIGECDRGERTRCAEFEVRKEMLIEFAKQKTEALREEVEDLKSDHEHNLGLMKGLNERIAELNKANEWYYPSKGELPTCDEETQLIFYVNCYYEFGGETTIRKRTVLGFYKKSFVDDDVKLFVEKSKGYEEEHLPKDVIAWKEIVLPKEIEQMPEKQINATAQIETKTYPLVRN